ncbi:MAG: lycopene cyclase domain-containing protein [Ignavibacteria bacterium]|nr:lycopene cyclase domain-containing protein [Ignavibacteria bacterium]
MNNTYLIINLLIILVPLALSFEKKIKFTRNIIPVLISILATSALFISWDIDATRRGDWSFNPQYVNSFKILGLPVEEILFFITVPYSILFVYECINYYLKNKDFSNYRIMLLIFSIIIFSAGILFIGTYYTSTVLLIGGLIFAMIFFFGSKILLSKAALITLSISIIPFLIVNYILTSLPVVIYNPDAITGIRFTTIPVEDFLYSLSLIPMCLFVYAFAKKGIHEKLLKKLSDQSKA